MSVTDSQNYCAGEVRRHDTDRYLASMFAPADRRADLIAVYAFNLEIAKLRETVSEPMLGQMRLQWWRETIAALYEGERRDNAVSIALAETVRRHHPPRAIFDELMDGRELDFSNAPPDDLAALESYVEATSSTVMRLALAVLGANDDAAARLSRHGGLAWGLTGLLRAVSFHAARGRSYLPREMLRMEGVSDADVIARRPHPGLAAVAKRMAEAARTHLDLARGIGSPRSALAAALPLTLVDGYLRRLERHGYDVFDTEIRTNRTARQIHLAFSACRGRF